MKIEERRIRSPFEVSDRSPSVRTIQVFGMEVVVVMHVVMVYIDLGMTTEAQF